MAKNTAISAIYKSCEAISDIRIATGNRICANYRERNKMQYNDKGDLTEAEKAALEAESLKILDTYVEAYRRVTDAISHQEYDIIIGKLPKPKKFIPDAIFTSYSELLLVDEYMRLLAMEETFIKQLEMSLEDYSIWTKYLKKVQGCGPKLAGMIVACFDIHKAKYPSSLHKYSGLDTVTVGVIKNDAGEDVIMSVEDIMAAPDMVSDDMVIYKGQVVRWKVVGRSKKKYCLVTKEYTTKDGEISYRKNITFKPEIQSKLLGVLAGAFLKTSVIYVNDEKMTAAARLKLAKENGFDDSKVKPVEMKAAVIEHLKNEGFAVVIRVSRHAQHYYNYKARLERSEKEIHKGLTKAHIHRMALRYMIKMFLNELYNVWRHLENLPIYMGYEVAKLGYTPHVDAWLTDEFGITVDAMEANEAISQLEQLPAAARTYVESLHQPAAVLKTA